jgi:nucleotide-binding universal stress UspA family protein
VSASAGPIVLAFDGSAAARRAVLDAAKLLVPRRTLVLTVWEPGLAYSTVAGSPDVSMGPAIEPSTALELDRELQSRAERVALEGAELARSLGLEAEPLAVADAGDVAHTILAIASEQQATAIVVGSRGLSGLRARLEGSTSKGVLKRASCPVIVVHDPGKDD